MLRATMHIGTLHRTVLCLLSLFAAATVAEARPLQRPPFGTMIDIARDTVAGRVILEAVYGVLATDLQRAARDTVSRAWHVALPRNADAGWLAFRDSVLRAVRGRALTEYDDERYSLAIDRVWIQSDTLIAEFSTGWAERCEASWWGNGTIYEMRATGPGAWKVLQTQPVGNSDGDCLNAMRGLLEARFDTTIAGLVVSLHEDARVRVRSSLLPAGWIAGRAFRNTTPNRCLMIAVETPGRRAFTFGALARVQVSTLYYGSPGDRPARIYVTGADTTGERWSEVHLPSVAARDSTCRG